MAHTNQGIFKKIIKKYEDVKHAYEECIKNYFNDDEEWGDGDSVSFWYFVDDSNGIFVKAKKLETKIENMLEMINFEGEKNEEKYKKMSEECQEIVEDIKERFDGMLRFYGELSDNEKAYIETLEIYK